MADQEKKTYIVGILHQHGKDWGTTIGKIDALDADDALLRSELWIAKKQREHNCKNHGNKCSVTVRQAYTSVNSMALAVGAEEILPKN